MVEVFARHLAQGTSVTSIKELGSIKQAYKELR